MSLPDEDDATRLGEEQVIDLYRSEMALTESLTLSDFLASHPEMDRQQCLVPLVIADIRWRQSNGKSFDPQFYFQEFQQLASTPDAWRILESVEAWLCEHEGSDWAVRWSEKYPGIASRFTQVDSDRAETSAVEPHLDDLRAGDRILDFEILKFIGAGTFGRVYLAKDQSLDRQCALKVTVDQGSEGRVLAKLGHPGITDVYREHVLDGRKLLAMQYVEGCSLAEWITGRSDAGAASGRVVDGVRIICRVATALQHAHVRGVLHLDIKPANILLDQHDKPLLSDFNVAMETDGDARFLVGGTINYMAPEQLQAVCLNDVSAERRVDTRSDLYSLGVVLLEALTGEKTWGVSKPADQQAAAHQLAASRLRSAPPDVNRFPGITPSLAAIIEKSLQPSPDARYQTAADFEHDLRCWLQDRNNVYAANPSLAESLRRNIRHHRSRWLGLAALGILLVGLFASLAVVTEKQLSGCELKTSEIDIRVDERRLQRASEMLGEARAQLSQAELASWIRPTRYAQAEQAMAQVSRRLAILENERFSSHFGEIILREVHDERTIDATALIKSTLASYNVLNERDWQSLSPFSDLSPRKQETVAERITELMLVSMFLSAREGKPTKQQVQAVLERLPEAHRAYEIFSFLTTSSEALTVSDDELGRSSDSFELYLSGVVATLENQLDTAISFYEASLSRAERERFWCHYRLAYSYQRLSRYQECFIHYGICIGLQPDFAWPKFNLGLVCLDTGKLSLGEAHIERAIQTDPEFTAGYVALMAIRIKRGHYDAAVEAYQAAARHGVQSRELEVNYQLALEHMSSRSSL